jgi:hypothetical protein
MSKDFTPHQEALELKELEFDEPCFAWYNLGGALLSDLTMGYEETDFLYTQDDMDNDKQCIAPLYQQAFRWFREKYQLHSYIEGAYPWFRFYINSEDNRWEGHKHLSHEEAELECLKKLIQIVKENKQ